MIRPAKSKTKLRYIREGDDSSDDELEEEFCGSSREPQDYIDYGNTDILLRPELDQVKIAFQHFSQKVTDLQKIKEFLSKNGNISKSAKVKKLVEAALDKKNPVEKVMLETYQQKGRITLDGFQEKVFAVLNIPIDYQDTGPRELDLSWSLVNFDFGLKIHSAKTVRDLYFPAKAKLLGGIEGLPDLAQILEVIQNSFAFIFTKKAVEEITNTAEYKQLAAYLAENNNRIFALLKSGDPVLNQMFDEVLEVAKDKPLNPEVLTNVRERHIETLVNNISHEIKTKGGLISSAKKAQNYIKNLTTHTTSYSKEVYNAVINSYNEMAKSTRKGFQQGAWVKAAQEKLDDAAHDLSQIQGLFMASLEKNIENELVRHLDRPTLKPKFGIMSPEDFNDSHTSHLAALVSSVRIDHCSTKRNIKNKSLSKDFRGNNAARGWMFDEEDLESVNYTTIISSSGGITHMVRYEPSKSSYDALAQRLRDIVNKSKGKITEQDIACAIKGLIQEHRVPEDIKLSESSEVFIKQLTFHLFGIEFERHPAASVHFAIGFDLLENGKKSLEWVFKHFPMAIEKAVSVVRCLQHHFKDKFILPYFYDKSTSDIAALDDIALQNHVLLEQELIAEWLESKGRPVEINQSNLELIGNFLQDYFDLSFD